MSQTYVGVSPYSLQMIHCEPNLWWGFPVIHCSWYIVSKAMLGIPFIQCSWYIVSYTYVADSTYSLKLIHCEQSLCWGLRGFPLFMAVDTLWAKPMLEYSLYSLQLIHGEQSLCCGFPLFIAVDTLWAKPMLRIPLIHCSWYIMSKAYVWDSPYFFMLKHKQQS